MTAANLDAYLQHFRYRVLCDALTEATAWHWLRRADAFERVKPRLDDTHGEATPSMLSEQWRRAHETAQACRNRAAVALVQDEYPDEVWAALHEAQGDEFAWDRCSVGEVA